MKILIVLSTILVGELVLSEELTRIANDGIDRLLNWFPINQRIPIGPYKFGDLEVNTGNLHLYSIKRSGDAVITKSADRSKYVLDMHLKPSYSEAIFRNMKINGDKMNGVFRINNGDLHLSYTVNHDRKDCGVHVDSIELETLTNVTLITQREEYSGRDYSFTFQNMFRPEINKLLVDYSSKFEWFVHFLCKYANKSYE